MELKKVEITKLPKYGSLLKQEFVNLEQPIEILVEDVKGDSGLVQPTTINHFGFPEQLDYIIQLSTPEKETATIGGGGVYVETILAPFFKNGKQAGILKIQKGKGNLNFGHLIPIECWNVKIID